MPRVYELEDRLPEVPGYTAEYVGETAVMPTVLAPSPGLPPRVKDTPLEISLVVYEAVPGE